MAKSLINRVLGGISGTSLAMMSVAVFSQPLAAQPQGDALLNPTPVTSSQSQRIIKGERYKPTIWIDPDGCEHWVMDDGAEGYGDNRLRRDGTPVCHEVNLCGVMNTDQYFTTDSYRVSKSGAQSLMAFFKKADAFAYTIVGHTDSRASDEYNMRLSFNRANAVAKVARSAGARVIDVRGYGERQPAASNASAAGMTKNRRVEILCFR